MLGNIALTRVYNAQVQGNLAGTIYYAEQAMQSIPVGDVFRRVQAAITLEFTHWATGDLQESLRATQAWITDIHYLGHNIKPPDANRKNPGVTSRPTNQNFWINFWFA